MSREKSAALFAADVASDYNKYATSMQEAWNEYQEEETRVAQATEQRGGIISALGNIAGMVAFGALSAYTGLPMWAMAGGAGLVKGATTAGMHASSFGKDDIAVRDLETEVYQGKYGKTKQEVDQLKLTGAETALTDAVDFYEKDFWGSGGVLESISFASDLYANDPRGSGDGDLWKS